MKYALEMGSGTKIYIPSFIKINSGIQELMAGIHRDTDIHGDLISLFLFLNKQRSKKISDHF
jgi:hypothetical protein